jgi:hypothetical protein
MRWSVQSGAFKSAIRFENIDPEGVAAFVALTKMPPRSNASYPQFDSGRSLFGYKRL